MEVFPLKLPSGKSVEIRLRRSDRARRILLRMTENGPELVIPRFAEEGQAVAFAQSQVSWLERVLRSVRVEKIQRPENMSLAFTGEKLTIEYLPLDVVWTGVRYKGPETLLVSGNTKTEETCILALRNWLKRKAVVELRPFAADVCSELGFELAGFTIGLQRRVWGTCSARRVIALNSALLFFPKEIVRYVIIHEGCHLTEMNHSIRFWNLVKKYYPYPEHARRVLNAPHSVPAWVHAKNLSPSR